MADFILQQKINRMILKSFPRIQNMRKPEKFTIGSEIQKCEFTMLRLAVEGNATRGSKRPYQTKLDTEKAVLQSFIDLAVSPQARLISPGIHEEWAKEIDEIGRLLGAWMKKTK